MAVPAQALIDCRGDIKLQEFSGRDEDWPAWAVKAHAFFAMMNWDTLVDSVEANREADVANAAMGEQAATVSKLLHALLTSKLKGQGPCDGTAGWTSRRLLSLEDAEG